MALTSEWDVYMSGALSALSPDDYTYVTTMVYDRVQKVCQKIQLTCYLPHKSRTAPNKGMPHSKVWEIDYKRVVNAGAVVAYVGIPSCGVGAEIEMARTANVPIILLFETKRQEELSRLILGNPAIKYVIPFDDVEEIDAQLEKCLVIIFSEKNLDEEAYLNNWSFRKREELREQLALMEKSVKNRAFFRDQPSLPTSREEWSHIGQQWDRENRSKNGRLDEFPKS